MLDGLPNVIFPISIWLPVEVVGPFYWLASGDDIFQFNLTGQLGWYSVHTSVDCSWCVRPNTLKLIMQSPHLNLTGQLSVRPDTLEWWHGVPTQSDWPAETSTWVTQCPHLSLTGQLSVRPIPWVGDMVFHLSLTGQLRLRLGYTVPHLSLTGQLSVRPYTLELVTWCSHLSLTGQLRLQTQYPWVGWHGVPSQSDWPADGVSPIPLSWVTWCPHLSLTASWAVDLSWMKQSPP